MDRPVLRYFGGKFKIAPWIIEQFPQHRIYVEPFGGGASVLIRKPRSYAEVYNDLDSEIVGVFRTFQNDFDALKSRLRNTPFSRSEYDKAYEPCEDTTERSARTIIRSMMGYGNSAQRAEGKTGFAAMNSVTGNTRASQWKNWLECLEQFHDRFMGVVIENRPALEVIAQQDTPGTLFYLDPPYVSSTRISGKYKHEMADADHRDLCATLNGIKGMAIISGYDNEIYAELGWQTKSISTLSMAGNDSASRKETIWISPRAAAAHAQAELFSEAATT